MRKRKEREAHHHAGALQGPHRPPPRPRRSALRVQFPVARRRYTGAVAAFLHRRPSHERTSTWQVVGHPASACSAPASFRRKRKAFLPPFCETVGTFGIPFGGFLVRVVDGVRNREIVFWSSVSWSEVRWRIPLTHLFFTCQRSMLF